MRVGVAVLMLPFSAFASTFNSVSHAVDVNLHTLRTAAAVIGDKHMLPHAGPNTWLAGADLQSVVRPSIDDVHRVVAIILKQIPAAVATLLVARDDAARHADLPCAHPGSIAEGLVLFVTADIADLERAVLGLHHRVPAPILPSAFHDTSPRALKVFVAPPDASHLTADAFVQRHVGDDALGGHILVQILRLRRGKPLLERNGRHRALL